MKMSLNEPQVQIQNIFTEMFLMKPSTKIAQMGLLQKRGVGRALEKTYLQIKSPEPLVQNQNNFTEIVLMLPST